MQIYSLESVKAASSLSKFEKIYSTPAWSKKASFANNGRYGINKKGEGRCRGKQKNTNVYISKYIFYFPSVELM